jgi:hypothetical protein
MGLKGVDWAQASICRGLDTLFRKKVRAGAAEFPTFFCPAAVAERYAGLNEPGIRSSCLQGLPGEQPARTIGRLHAVTGEVPYTVLVMIDDQRSAGRIVVELDAFSRFNIEFERQLAELEAWMSERLPQLARRSTLQGRGERR